MKHHNAVYFFGSVLLFLGLFWMFLPHAYHNKLDVPSAENQEHITDIFEGVAAALGGLGFMVLSNHYAEQHETKASSNNLKKP